MAEFGPECKGRYVAAQQNRVERSNLIRPFPGPVLHKQDFYLRVLHPIRDDVWRTWYHQFTRPFDLTNSANKRIG
jgi:hypothetical protein